MNTPASIGQEQNAAAAFSKQSSIFDELYRDNSIVSYKRQRVRDHVSRFLKPQSQILELNCGTGEDAIYFANKGYNVHATDISGGMLRIAREKIQNSTARDKVTTEQCSFTDLDNLRNRGPFNLIFSNFAGLNCTDQLQKVLQSFSPLLSSDGVITLVILPKLCLWELLLAFRGKFKTAFRRFFSRSGRTAHIEGEFFHCWYYNPSFVLNTLQKDFDLVALEGLCTIVPPSYIEGFAEKHPRAFHFLKNMEGRWKDRWPFRSIGDYYIISLRKKQA